MAIREGRIGRLKSYGLCAVSSQGLTIKGTFPSIVSDGKSSYFEYTVG